jgi:hypothetical protein
MLQRPKPKLSRQIDYARKLIDNGEGRHHVAELLNVDRITLKSEVERRRPHRHDYVDHMETATFRAVVAATL